MDAQGALDSLLGRLTTVLVEEAQLLGRVRGDVEFIKDEMEFMNSLLLHLTEAQHRAHHVRTWMKQVTGLARDCEGNIELYVHYVATASGGKGVFGLLTRIPRFLRTVRARHEIATRIRELKVRAHDVGERRQRYGVAVPELGTDAVDNCDNPWTRGVSYWRNLIFEDDGAQKDEGSKQKCFNSLLEWLREEPPPPYPRGREPPPRVFAIPGTLSRDVAWSLFMHYVALQGLYDTMVFEHCRREKQDAREILETMVGSMRIRGADASEDDDLEQLVSKKIQQHLKGKRFLVCLQNVDTTMEEWSAALHTLSHADECYRDSRIVITTDSYDKAKSLSPDRIHICQSYAEIVLDEAKKRDRFLSLEQHKASYHKILDVLYPYDIFAMMMFQHLLLCYRNRIGNELEEYLKSFEECKQQKKSIAEQMIMFCYKKLPSKYRSCLLYLTIFPKGHIIRAKSLVRRWMSEGLIATNTTTDDTWMPKDEAMHYFKMLLNTGFLDPVEICDMGDIIKSCKVHDEVHKFISRTARDVNFVDSDLPLNLARHLSIHNRMGLQLLHSDPESHSIVALLPTLAASSNWQLLKVLDLEDCKLLKKCHVKSISKILLLRYLSLRNTGITYLPKKIKQLRCLETLDIRQTEIQVVSKKVVVLPQLKHFLAGHKVRLSNDVRRPEEPFPMVRMPFCFTGMKNLEILYHVHVADNGKEVAGIVQLQKLRKLGVILHGENAKLNDLFCEAEKLHSCLRSLSIQVVGAASSSYHPGEARLPCKIEEFHILSKLTLSGTYLKESDIRILGRLPSLSCLWFRPRSYIGSVLPFKPSEFRRLKALTVEGEEITNISFDSGTTPSLGSIVWSFVTMEGISGLNRVFSLRKLELNGDCNSELILAIERCNPHLQLTHNPHHQSQEKRTAAVPSTSSAP